MDFTQQSGRMKKVALASCSDPHFAEVERYVNELALVQKAVQKLGVYCDVVPWDKVGVCWENYDAVVICQTWDYTVDFPKFTSWLKDVSAKCKLINDYPILNWSSNKVYLNEFADAGVPVVPTSWLQAEAAQEFDAGELRRSSGWGAATGIIIKPAVGCGSQGILYLKAGGATEDEQTARARAHLAGQFAAGQTHLLAQPFLPAVKSFGEISAVYIDGAFSHALLKTPSAADFRVQKEFGGVTRVVAATAPMVEVCERVMEVLGAVCARLGTEPVLYARIDLLPADEGLSAFYVCEVELLEPELFFQDAVDHLRSQDTALQLSDDHEWSHVRYAKGIVKRLA
jgi:glutathione synthase/RimK-type ligase-like ATP-grasp enzyme